MYFGRWDNLKDGQLGLDNMKKKLLEVGGAELVPITITAAPPYVYPEHCHNYVSWDGLVGGPATYYITHLDGKDEVIIFYLRRRCPRLSQGSKAYCFAQDSLETNSKEPCLKNEDCSIWCCGRRWLESLETSLKFLRK